MAKKEYSNERTCLFCGQRADKQDLLRIVIKEDNGCVVFDEKQCMRGRGAYIHKKGECLNKKSVEKVLRRAFKIDGDKKIFYFDAFSKMKNFLNLQEETLSKEKSKIIFL